MELPASTSLRELGGSGEAALVSRHRLHSSALALCLLSFAWLVQRTAWLSDDAFISLRTVDNFLHGYGLRWNVDERVQTFTHPLWLLVLSAAHALTGEPFYSTMYLSCLVSLGCVACLLFACPGIVWDKLLALFVLMCSQSFVDFCSSGLENPLTHLLLVAFVAIDERAQTDRARTRYLALIAGLAAFNRLDTSLLFIPRLAQLAWLARKQIRPVVVDFVLGAIPLAIWEVFSIVYYGFPFPNTAYAKLAQGPEHGLETLTRGFRYLASSWTEDPITLLAIAASIGLALYRRDRKHAFTLAGAAAYVVYVVRIGGDFMSGRFLSAPLVLCCACFVSADWLRSLRFRASYLLVASVAAAFSANPPLFSPADFGYAQGEKDVNQFGLHNERRLFFNISSLRNADVMQPTRPDHPWSRNGMWMREVAKHDPSQRVQVVDAIGYAGYFAGPQVHIVDHWALADALIARLPPVFGQYGHFPRALPDEYLETLAAGKNLITDPDLHLYYGELSKVLHDPLFSGARWAAIWKLNTGQLKEQLDRYSFVRGKELKIVLPFRNNTSYPSVTTYVWNAKRTQAYTLDTASTPGKSYAITWKITPEQSTLLMPPDALKTSDFGALAEGGFFTVSVAFSDQPGGAIRDLHELRYTYRREGEQLVVQRQPWPVWIQNFPEGPWNDGRAPGVFGREQTH